MIAWIADATEKGKRKEESKEKVLYPGYHSSSFTRKEIIMQALL